MNRMAIAVFALLLAGTCVWPATAATRWNPVSDPQTISWVATDGSGTAIKGACAAFTSDIAFDPDDLANASVRVEIDTASCKTGEEEKDTYLPQATWFDVASYPVAVFSATSFSHENGNDYVADGTLTLKGVSLPVKLPFALEIKGDTAHVTGKTVINRLNFGIGSGQMATSQVAGPNVTVAIDLRATRAKSGEDAQ